MRQGSTPPASAAGASCSPFQITRPPVQASSPFCRCMAFPAWLYDCLQDLVSSNQTWLHWSLTSWSFPDLLGIIPVREKFLLAEGAGSRCGLSLSKAGYKLQLSALLLVVGLESCDEQKLFWMFWGMRCYSLGLLSLKKASMVDLCIWLPNALCRY